MRPWLTLLGLIVALVAVHIATMAFVSRGVGLGPKTVDFGFGPTVKQWTVGGVDVRLHAALFGGSVSPDGEDASVLRFAAPSFVATALLMSAGVVALGGTDGIAFASTVVSALFGGAVSPTGAAQTIIADIIASVRAGPAMTIGARTAVAMGVFNFLLVTWTPLLRNSKRLNVVAALLPLTVSAPWMFAGVYYIL